MMSEQEAREIAQRALSEMSVGSDVVLNDSATVSTGHAWVFFYNTRRFLETGSVIHALAGNGPIIVDPETGTYRIARTDIPWQDQV